jgi:hypothetical protein
MIYMRLNTPANLNNPSALDVTGKRIFYNSPMGLAHEVAHAIELKLKQCTSEYGAWKLAYSFLKPKFWNPRIARACYATYAITNLHQRYVHGTLGTPFIFSERVSGLPNTLDFLEEKDGKEDQSYRCRNLQLRWMQGGWRMGQFPLC